jgi:hypothetical protein
MNREIFMNMRSYAIVSLTLSGLLGAAGVTAADLAAATPAQGAGSVSSPAQGEPDASQSGSAPVLHVSSVEIIRSAHSPVMDIIRVRGLASTSGWEEAELVPLTRGIPADGILDLVLVARAPSEATDAKGFETVEAVFPLEPEHPFKGVNVHGALDSLSVTQLPGYAENKAVGEDCSKCVGKTFVARGASAPAGKASAELLREEQLPSGTRVVKHSDGIPTAESNPNRLTLILSKDGKVTTAVWD